MRGLRFGVGVLDVNSNSQFCIYGLWFLVLGLGFGVRDLGSGVWGLRFKVLGFGFRVWGLEVRVEEAGVNSSSQWCEDRREGMLTLSFCPPHSFPLFHSLSFSLCLYLSLSLARPSHERA